MLMFVFRRVILNLTSARVAKFAFSPFQVRISMALDRTSLPTAVSSPVCRCADIGKEVPFLRNKLS